MEASGTFFFFFCYAKHTSPTLRSFAVFELRRDVHEHSSVILIGWVGLPRDVDVTSLSREPGGIAQLTTHSAVRHFHLAFTLRSFDVGHECNIHLSASERYTNYCAIPPFQNKQIDRVVVARYTALVSCLTGLDDCVVFVDRVGVFLEHMPRILKLSERFPPDFPVVSFLFCLYLKKKKNCFALVASTATVAAYT